MSTCMGVTVVNSALEVLDFQTFRLNKIISVRYLVCLGGFFLYENPIVLNYVAGF